MFAPWLPFHGRPEPVTGYRPADVRRDPLAAIATLEAATAEMRLTLDAAHILTVEGVASAQMYVRRMLGEGYMVREDPARDGIRNLPRNGRMFTVMLGGPLPHVVLDKGRLTVVAVDFF